MTGETFGAALGEPIEIVPYDPAWTARFATYAAQIGTVLGATALRVDHVGSTAVPGLAAKPVIDIQVIVPDPADEPRYRSQLEATGVTLRVREPEWVFFRPASLPRTHHVHVTSTGTARERRQLLFVAYLTAEPARRRAYQDLKIALAARLADDREAYFEGKTSFVAETLQLAERWAADTGWAPPRAERGVVVR